MFRRAERPLQAAVGERRTAGVHQAHRELDAQDARDRVVNARHRHAALAGQFPEQPDELAVVVGHHHHVHAGVDHGLNLLPVGAGEPLLRAVVGDEEALEAEFVLEDFGQQHAARRALHAVPTAVRRHDGSHARRNGREIPVQVEAAERGVVEPGISLVETIPRAVRQLQAGAEDGAAVAREVFGAGQHAQRIVESGALQSAYRRLAQHLHHGGRLAVAFISAPPAHVLWHRDAGPKRPVDA